MCLTGAVHILNAKKDLTVIFITCTLHCVSSGNGYFNPAKVTLTGFPGGSDSKRVCPQCRRPGFDPWVGKIPWRRKWQPTPIFLPGKSHGRRSLVGYCPWSWTESDMAEQLTQGQNWQIIFGCRLLMAPLLTSG